MNYSLLIQTAPAQGRSYKRAEAFSNALMREHSLQRVFFYGAGVQVVLPQEGEPSRHWARLQRTSGAELILCSASAERYGISSPPPEFIIGGLGSLMESGADSQRIISFV